MRVTEHLWIPLPDGRRLAAKLWLPTDEAPAPAILEYLPYRKRDGTVPRDVTTYPVFAAAGYAGIRVDIAGTGESDGLFDDEYSERELADGEAAIAWIAAQPWCDGSVGMIGISWGGFNGLQLAFRRPPALKAIVTVCSTTDRYADDIHYMGGCLLTDNFAWGAQMTAYQTRPPDPALRADWRDRWLERIEHLPFLAADWLRHPLRDGYWKHGSVCEDWGAIRAATLAIGGWADAYVNTPPALAAHLTTPVKALMGPWEHKYPHIARINPADFHGEVIGWFDRWLKGVDNGADRLPAYRAFVQEFDPPSRDYGPRSGRWVAEQAWPSPNVAEQVLHLTGTGLAGAPGDGTAAVATPLTVGQGGAYFCAGMRIGNELSGDQASDDAASLCFDTESLAAPLELLGRPAVELSFTVDRPVAQLCLRLCDVAPNGVSQRITYRLANLALAPDHASGAPLAPDSVYTVRVPLNECAHRLEPGHRLRLAVSTSYWPVVWPSPHAATVTLHLADCRLVLPERRGGEDTEPLPPPRPLPPSGLVEEWEPAYNVKHRTERDGTVVRETFDDFGVITDPAHDLDVYSHVREIVSIRPGDPLSARQEIEWYYQFDRDDWMVGIRSKSVMTCTADTFVLERTVTAYESHAAFLERQWREEVPRGLL